MYVCLKTIVKDHTVFITTVPYVSFGLCTSFAGQKQQCAMDCSCILVAVPCILVASVCTFLCVYIGWPVVAQEHGKIFIAGKKAFFFVDNLY